MRVIDWDEPENNDFFLASQFWVTGDMYKRRADLVGFVNGLPLRLHRTQGRPQAPGARLQRQPERLQGHHPAAVLVQRLHHPVQRQREPRSAASRPAGSTSPSGRRSTARAKQGVVSLETMIRGTCEPDAAPRPRRELHRLRGSQGRARSSCVAKNHQYLGVNNAIDAVQQIEDNQGRLGVFWHTQGSGKSFSMVFFAQKVLRKLPGNWTFVVVTDREDLDDQIYKNFAGAGRRHRAEQRPGRQRRAPQAAAARGSPLRLHADPEVPHREGRDVSRCSPTAPTSSS